MTSDGPVGHARATPAVPTVYAIDFGTSNSLLAAANAHQVFAPAPVDPTAPDPTILRSILYFPGDKSCFVGHAALLKYVERGMEGRFIRSLKRHLPVRSFRGTQIDARTRANAHYGVDVRKVVLGRPARFAEDDEADDLAETRLRLAAERAGFEEVHCLPEPVAAAREFRHAQGGIAQNVMVCDFGGGTSDFTVLRLREHRVDGSVPAFDRGDVLAIGGVSVAGDAFDAALMRGHVAKHFGAAVEYRVPLGNNVLGMPKQVTEQLCSPAHLSILRRPDVAEFLRNVRGWSLGGDDREKLDQLTTLVDDALGFQLFEAIESGKKALSTHASTSIQFSYPEIEVSEAVTREGFEGSAATATRAILASLDATLQASGLPANAIDVVCCTGGTAKVPRIAAELAHRFGADKIRQFSSFHAVVTGLARHAQALA
jgi:hypothetical chaperone protein